MKKSLLISYWLLILAMPFSGMAGEPLPVKKDYGKVTIRKFEEEQINEYRTQKEFNYRLQKPAEMSLWDRFWNWVWEQYYRAMENKGFRVGFKVFLWILAIGVAVFVILRIVGMEKVMWLVKGRKEAPLNFVSEDTDIYAINFNEAIEDAISKKEFRLAIRLLYLKSLRQLADKNLIHWKINKTNVDYSAELSRTNFADSFNLITRIYEFAWYGEFAVDEDAFRQAQLLFNQFQQKLPA